jgi:hypothetical protein
MRLRPTLRWIATAALVLGAAGSATAQQPAGGAPGGGDTGQGNGQVGFQRNANLSPQEELSQANSILTQMDQRAGTVRRQLEQARAARDVVKTLCLNDKLSQIDVAIRSARDRQASLQAAAQRNDAELANHEFTILTVLRQRAEQLTAEANQCIGEEVAFVGATQVVTQIEPGLPTGDMTDYPPTDPTLVTGPPQCTSCTGGP